MPAPRTDRPPTAAGFAPVLVANLLPLAGIVVLGWDPATLVVIYAIEVLLSIPVASVKALFAQQPPRTDGDENGGVISVADELVHKRGSVTVTAWLPPVYPRTVPFAVRVLEALWMYGLFVGVVLGAAVPVGSVLARPGVAVSVAALVAGQVIDTWQSYVRTGRYEDVTPYTVVETPARQVFFLIVVSFVVPFVGTDATAALAVLVGFKLLVEWSGHRAGEGGRLTAWLAGPDPAAEAPEPISVPDGEPDARVRTDDRAVLWTGVVDTLVRVAPFYGMWAVFAWFGGLAMLGSGAAPTVGIALSVAVLTVFVGLLAVEVGTFYLRDGPLEYRRYGDRLVAYDTLVDEPQWATRVDVLRDATVVSDRLVDRLLGTRTVTVTTGWGDDEESRDIGPVADGEALVTMLEVPVATTELEPMDRRVVAGVCVLVAVLVAVGGASVIDSGPESLLSGVFVAPFVVFVSYGIWQQAYPDRGE